MERAEYEVLKPAIESYDRKIEQARKEEEAKLMAEQRKREEDARLRMAVSLEKAGDADAADEIISAPVVLPPVVVPKENTNSSISFRESWGFVVREEALIPRQFLCIDEKKLSSYARIMKGEANVPGVDFFMERIVSGRSV